MKYYIKNYKEIQKGKGYMPSPLMDKCEAVGLFIKLRKEFFVSTREFPVLCNENGEEMDSILHVVAGERVYNDAFLIHIEFTHKLTERKVDDYYTPGNNRCVNEVAAILGALSYAERNKPDNSAITKLELVF